MWRTAEERLRFLCSVSMFLKERSPGREAVQSLEAVKDKAMGAMMPLSV